MPRQSADARSAAELRDDDGELLLPPEELSEAQARIWNRVVASKPADWFDAGSAELLASYCVISVQIQHVLKLLRSPPPLPPAKTREERRYERLYNKLMAAPALEKRLCALAATQTTLATKLRLSVQATVHAKSRKLAERGAPEDSLLGGDAIVRPGRRRDN